MSESRPAIGIFTALTDARWGVWNQPAALLPAGYVTAVQRAGGLALMITARAGADRRRPTSCSTGSTG